MITEIARIEIDSADAVAFEAAVAEAMPYFRAAHGCRSFRLDRSVDRAGQYQLVVDWDSVDAHMVDFRATQGFAAWRALAGPFFRAPPQVDHVEPVFQGF